MLLLIFILLLVALILAPIAKAIGQVVGVILESVVYVLAWSVELAVLRPSKHMAARESRIGWSNTKRCR